MWCIRRRGGRACDASRRGRGWARGWGRTTVTCACDGWSATGAGGCSALSWSVCVRATNRLLVLDTHVRRWSRSTWTSCCTRSLRMRRPTRGRWVRGAGRARVHVNVRVWCAMVPGCACTLWPVHVMMVLHQHQYHLHMDFTPRSAPAVTQVVGTGLPASPGAAVGQAVFSAEEAEAWVGAGLKVSQGRGWGGSGAEGEPRGGLGEGMCVETQARVCTRARTAAPTAAQPPPLRARGWCWCASPRT